MCSELVHSGISNILTLLLQAYRRGLWYPRYHFILLGWYSANWWKQVNSTDCTVKQIEQVNMQMVTAKHLGLLFLLMAIIIRI